MHPIPPHTATPTLLGGASARCSHTSTLGVLCAKFDPKFGGFGEIAKFAKFAMFCHCLHNTPNSAAAERIFSQMKDMFGAKQASALADMLQAAMMLRYHKRLA